MDRRDLRAPLLSSENDPGVSLAMPSNLMSPSYTLHKSGCSSHSRLLGECKRREGGAEREMEYQTRVCFLHCHTRDYITVAISVVYDTQPLLKVV
jgi:hypothetical protein